MICVIRKMKACAYQRLFGDQIIIVIFTMAAGSPAVVLMSVYVCVCCHFIWVTSLVRVVMKGPSKPKHKCIYSACINVSLSLIIISKDVRNDQSV